MANIYGGNNTGRAGLRLKEVDGTPDVAGVSEIIVSNGTLTDNGGGIVTLTTGGGGGGGVTLSGSTNNTITTVTGANALLGEANLTFDGTTLTTTGLTNTGNSSLGNAASDTIGFHGATPLIQRTAANTSIAPYAPGIPAGPIDLADTFGGYTITQIVGALQDLGLLA